MGPANEDVRDGARILLARREDDFGVDIGKALDDRTAETPIPDRETEDF